MNVLRWMFLRSCYLQKWFWIFGFMWYMHFSYIYFRRHLASVFSFLVWLLVTSEIPVCSLRRCWQKRGEGGILLTAENSNIPFHQNPTLHETNIMIRMTINWHTICIKSSYPQKVLVDTGSPLTCNHIASFIVVCFLFRFIWWQKVKWTFLSWE